jgi:hypothetical protein
MAAMLRRVVLLPLLQFSGEADAGVYGITSDGTVL